MGRQSRTGKCKLLCKFVSEVVCVCVSSVLVCATLCYIFVCDLFQQ